MPPDHPSRQRAKAFARQKFVDRILREPSEARGIGVVLGPDPDTAREGRDAD